MAPAASAASTAFDERSTGRSWQLPPAESDRQMVAGVASGLAREVGVDPVYVRAAFVVLTIASGFGVLVYAATWAMMRRRWPDGSAQAGYVPTPRHAPELQRIVAVAMIVAGLLLLTANVGILFQPAIVWPAALVAAAFAVAADRGQIERHHLAELHTDAHLDVRLGIGLALLLAGMVAALLLNFTLLQALRSIVVAGFVLCGAAVLLAPLLIRLGDELLVERRLRIRSEERADLAAHLHDSVLQTLALIQKRSADPGVVKLARRQERELRAWLFDRAGSRSPLDFRQRLEAELAEIEELHEVPIEVVVVGDHAVDSGLEALLKATREAAANAVRHSEADQVDVFAEVGRDRVEVFVRDQGVGFAPESVESDRVGIRESIHARMERHGGSAHVWSQPGAGTEVELSMPLDRAADPDADVGASEDQEVGADRETIRAATPGVATERREEDTR